MMMVDLRGKNARGKDVKKVFENAPGRKKSVGKPKNRWLEEAENDLKKIGVNGWKLIADDRDAWKLMLEEARAIHGP